MIALRYARGDEACVDCTSVGARVFNALLQHGQAIVFKGAMQSRGPAISGGSLIRALEATYIQVEKWCLGAV
jgi:hypothetical protein